MKRFERSYGLDTALYKNYLYLNKIGNAQVSKGDNTESTHEAVFVSAITYIIVTCHLSLKYHFSFAPQYVDDNISALSAATCFAANGVE